MPQYYNIPINYYYNKTKELYTCRWIIMCIPVILDPSVYVYVAMFVSVLLYFITVVINQM